MRRRALKSEEFTTAVRIWGQRLILTVILHFCAVANSLLFTLFPTDGRLPAFHYSLLNAQQTQSGKASFYSKRATGARTANGERLHHDSMTCAHRTYPFGTMLKVTNMANGKEVVVRVTDRGPYRKGRIIDLSWGAAKAIGMIAQGITQVKVERLSPGFVVPFKPEESPLNQPIYEFEIAEIEDTATPIWKVDEKIDDKKAKSQMRKTATDARRARSATTAAPADTKAVPQAQPVTTDTKKAQPVTTDTKKAPQKEAATPTDVLDEINSQPNRSKAYLKRQGKK